MGENKKILFEKYEMGRLLGKGTFAKVYQGRNLATGEHVAIKVIKKDEAIRSEKMMEQIKREIAVMRLVRHPNIVDLKEVMATRSKIFLVVEYVRGGELFAKVERGRLKETAARKYFQQLIAAVDFCHSRGVYHRDLKPENLLLDESGNLKVTDFGLSALIDSNRQDGLLHTTCGTPAYVAPEVINKRGYDGVKADIWSCGVILYVLLAGYLPFHDSNLMEMYKKISRGDFRCPHWFPPEVRKLLSRILDPHPSSRITISKIMDNSWFKKGFQKVESPVFEDIANEADSSDPICEVLDSDSDSCSCKKKKYEASTSGKKPQNMNAFDLISLSPGFDLSGLFEDECHHCKDHAWFTTREPPSMVVSRLEELATTESFKIKQKDGTVKMQGRKEGRKGQLTIDAEIYEVVPSFHMVEVKKSSGDTLEYMKFCDQGLKPSLKDIVWSWEGSSG